MRLTKFGTITLPELNGRDNGIGSQARNNLITLKDGAFDLDGSSIYLEPMTISRSAILTDDIDDSLDDLFGEMRKGRMVLQSEMRDGSLRHTFAKMNLQMRDISADKYTCEQQINLQWNANYPYWLDSALDYRYFDHGGTFDDETDLTNFDDSNFEVTTLDDFFTQQTITVDNESKFRIYRIFINWQTSGNFSCDNLKMINETNGCQIHWNSTLDTSIGLGNKRLDIDCLNKRAFSSNLINEYKNIEIVGNESLDWFYLEPGENTITFSLENGLVGSGNIAARIIWTTHYL